MIKYTVLCSMFFTLTVCAQQAKFHSLIDLFVESDQTIPENLAMTFFDFKATEGTGNLLTGEIIVKNDKYIIVSTLSKCSSTGTCKKSTLSSFTLVGDRVASIAFERTIADCSFDDTRKSVFISKNLLVFKETRKKLDCLGDGKQTGIKTWLEFQPIKEDGTFLKPYTELKDINRENYIFSHKIFTKEELYYKTDEELSIIKNEIFAAHGYMFTKKKWQDYFESKSWYLPLGDDITMKLTEIEKKNIELILSLTQ